MKFRIMGDVESNVNNCTYDFSLTTKFKSKWSQISIIRNFVRKWNKLQRVRRSGQSAKNLRKILKISCKKRHGRVPMDKKMKALNAYF